MLEMRYFYSFDRQGNFILRIFSEAIEALRHSVFDYFLKDDGFTFAV